MFLYKRDWGTLDTRETDFKVQQFGGLEKLWCWKLKTVHMLWSRGWTGVMVFTSPQLHSSVAIQSEMRMIQNQLSLLYGCQQHFPPSLFIDDVQRKTAPKLCVLQPFTHFQLFPLYEIYHWSFFVVLFPTIFSTTIVIINNDLMDSLLFLCFQKKQKSLKAKANPKLRVYLFIRGGSIQLFAGV